MRINILVDEFAPYSGQSKVALTRVKAFIEMGYNVKIWTTENKFGNLNFDIELLDVIKIRQLPLISKFIKLQHDDIIISESANIGNFFLQNKNFYFVFHGITPKYLNRGYLYSKYAILPQIKISKSCFSVSDYAKDQFKKLYGLDSKVIYNSIDPDFYMPLEIQKKYDIGAIKRGSLAKRNIEHLLEESNISIKWAQGVPESEMPSFYNQLKVLLNLTEWESFGLPFIEAMSCGIPVIGLNNSATPEIVGNGGIICETVEEALILAQDLVDDSEKRNIIGSKGRNEVIKRFNYLEQNAKLIEYIQSDSYK